MTGQAPLETLISLWPLLVSIFGLWIGGMGVAIGLTMWIMGQLAKQDSSRIEMKEAVLLEIRQKHESLQNHIDKQHDEMWAKINELSIRLTRVETKLDGH